MEPIGATRDGRVTTPGGTAGTLDRDLEYALDRSISWLKENQKPDGYWVGRLETNCTMEAEWILGMHFLGVHDDPKYDRVVGAILEQQRPDGSWAVFYGAPAGEISATIECYAALRCAGLDPDSEALKSAREWIMAHGGFKHIRVFTRMWLALIGEWPWSATPQLPPEIILAPAPWFPFNIYQFSSWARATLVPLAVVSALRPVRPLPEGRRLDELFPHGRDAVDYSLPRHHRGLSWESFFLATDRLLSWYVKSPVKPLRETSIRACLEWIIRHQDADGAWGGIQPPWIYSLIALHACGYPLNHPVMAKGLDGFAEPWAVHTGDTTYLQASNSPVWDTLLTLVALLDAEAFSPDEEWIERALRWIIQQEVRIPGDWQVVVKGVEPSGWAFEYENDLYPDLDDTAVAIQMFARARETCSPALSRTATEVIERATRWLVAFQCRNGGWASFDKDNDHPLITKIPFCDFGEVLDPPSVDVTAHVIEALGHLGRDKHDPVVRRALDWIMSEQEPDGSWFGRWGVNHVYGCGCVLPALRAVGYDMSSPEVRKAAAWLVGHQNADGGWGESCSSYMSKDLRGAGPSTASQTAWGLMGLLAMSSPEYDQAILAGIGFLTHAQRSDGTWDEPYYTGTGFPGYGLGKRIDVDDKRLPQGLELGRGFMLNYNMYRHYFPIAALGRARRYFRNRTKAPSTMERGAVR